MEKAYIVDYIDAHGRANFITVHAFSLEGAISCFKTGWEECFSKTEITAINLRKSVKDE